MTKMLIIDDDRNWTKIVYNYIIIEKKLIDQAIIIYNGKEAIGNINNADVILLDLDIPNINGMDIINNYAKDKKNIIIMTGRPELINVINFDSYKKIGKILIKPFDLNELAKEINILLKEANFKEVEKRAEEIINEIAINSSRIGYTYLKMCIIEGYKNLKLTENLQEKLYQEVADILELKNTKRIKWNVEKIIKEIMENSQSEIIESNFSNRVYVTPKVFIKKIISIL